VLEARFVGAVVGQQSAELDRSRVSGTSGNLGQKLGRRVVHDGVWGRQLRQATALFPATAAGLRSFVDRNL
jgi:hypothetical protein